MIIALTDFNTIVLAAGTVYQLVTSNAPSVGPVFYNVLNMGPDSVYIRDSEDPVVGDAASETLPANAADNGIFVAEGSRGIRFLAGPGGATISIRVDVPQYA